MLEKDYQYQKCRLSSVKTDDRIKNSTARQEWFKVHRSNTEILSQLVELMKKHPEGNTIIYLKQKNEFRIKDLNSGILSTVKAILPDVNKELSAIINNPNKQLSVIDNNDDLATLLRKFGINGNDI